MLPLGQVTVAMCRVGSNSLPVQSDDWILVCSYVLSNSLRKIPPCTLKLNGSHGVIASILNIR